MLQILSTYIFCVSVSFCLFSVQQSQLLFCFLSHKKSQGRAMPQVRKTYLTFSEDFLPGNLLLQSVLLHVYYTWGFIVYKDLPLNSTSSQPLLLPLLGPFHPLTL